MVEYGYLITHLSSAVLRNGDISAHQVPVCVCVCVCVCMWVIMRVVVMPRGLWVVDCDCMS